ncbi:MAG: tRNA preQ1(34) S-adenosylmethionine ribosyltransferase-isomerase QueA [Nitrospirae bacterium]|nr:tRNA preQ1(34) S-adenosylmethionine ribosyltransferase-isomerase QueA [Nitrospirota bacterium]
MNTADFSYPLPDSLIVHEPAHTRDQSRLLVLNRDGSVRHRRFHEILNYLNKGDILVLNKTKVLRARLQAFKPTGGRLDILLVKHISNGRWEILCPKRYTGKISVNAIKGYVEHGRYLVFSGTKDELLGVGMMPLPPYIKRKPDERDIDWYQTVYASEEGSIAAPTAGLHFTQKLLSFIEKKGVILRYLTLHVGKGTFMPVRANSLKDHRMETEYFEMPSSLISEIKEAKANGKRVISVGTTTTRALEAVMSHRFRGLAVNGFIKGETDLFITPGFEFKALDSLITNFHLPCSTPLILTSAFSGKEKLLSAYKVAIRMGYRFFSYGDAMLIK